MTGTTKYTNEQINFILERTVREIARGDTNRVHAQTVEEFKKKFGVEDFGPNQVRYVTDRYGTDPIYGNRAANLIRGRGAAPALLAFDRNTMPDNLTASAKRAVEKGNKSKSVVCEHCGGLGTIPINRPIENLGRRTEESQQTTGIAPRAIEYPTYRPQIYQQADESTSPTVHFPPGSYLDQQYSSVAQQQLGNAQQLRIYDSTNPEIVVDTGAERYNSKTASMLHNSKARHSSDSPLDVDYGMQTVLSPPMGEQRTSSATGNMFDDSAMRYGSEFPMDTNYAMHMVSGSGTATTAQQPYIAARDFALDRNTPSMPTSQYLLPTTADPRSISNTPQPQPQTRQSFQSHGLSIPQTPLESVNNNNMCMQGQYTRSMSRGTVRASTGTPGAYDMQEQQRVAKRAKTMPDTADPKDAQDREDITMMMKGNASNSNSEEKNFGNKGEQPLTDS